MNDMYHVLKLGRWDILLLQKLKCNKKRSIKECYRKELVLKTPTLTLAQGCLPPLLIVATNLAEAPLDAYPWEEQTKEKHYLWQTDFNISNSQDEVSSM